MALSLQLLAGIILLKDLADPPRSSWSPHFSLCTHSEEAHCATHIKSPETPTMAHLGNHPGEFSEYLPRSETFWLSKYPFSDSLTKKWPLCTRWPLGPASWCRCKCPLWPLEGR